MSSGEGTPKWEEIERAIGAFLELAEEQRAAYVAQQPPLIRAEVESLLAAYRRSGNFLGDETAKPIADPDLLGRMKAMLAIANSERSAAVGLPDERVESVRGSILGRAGTQLGPYRIESIIGEGGMGVVYRAFDTKLNRPVAVKFLFDDLADPAARRRFQREAQMASSLNHPHILTVYDAGDFEGRQYLVTEFIDGGTLKGWARAEKRTWREIAALLVGVADGLASAHAAGILHRDIKPDNILVGTNGYAKLSDFGLAKLEERISQAEVTRTLESKPTRPGVILGTIAYMSPEQASGRPTDARSDIFSFGILLYELLAGRRPFEGATDLEVLQTIIHGAVSPLGPDVPLALWMVVEKTLEKDPAERYQSTRDLVVDLRRLARQGGAGALSASASPLATSVKPAQHSWKTGAALGVLALLLAGGLLLLWFKRPSAQGPRQVVQFDIAAPPGTIFAPPIMRQPFAISPDGTRLALIATGPIGTNIWVRDLASLELRVVPGTDGADTVFWSLDNRSLYYSVKRVLKQADLETGSGRLVAELPSHAQLGTWRSKGDLVLYLGMDSNFYEVLAENGSARETNVGKEMRWPQFLPGGDRLVYVAPDSQHHIRAMATDYANPKPVSLMESDSRVEYAPPRSPGEPAYLLFLRGASLMAEAFDPDRLRMAGEPFPIARNVVYYGSTLSPSFSVSENGVLVYQADFPISELKWYDRTGHEVGAAGKPAAYWGTLRVSADGRRVSAIVFSPENGGTDIWVFDANGRESRRLTMPPEQARRPIWSPDGKRLAYGRSMPGNGPELATLDLDGSGHEELFPNASTGRQIGDAPPRVLPTDWSKDGRFIAFDSGIPEEGPEVWVADVASRTIMPLLPDKILHWGIAFSPDVKQIAFVSVESNRPEVYLQAFDPKPAPHVAGERRQLSTDGAWLVRWRADGRELFYLGSDNWLYSVRVSGLLQFGEPERLFRIPGTQQYDTTRDFQFDVSPDGQRFLMTTTGSVAPPPFTVIENWQDKFHR